MEIDDVEPLGIDHLLHVTMLLAVAHQLLLVGLVEGPRLAAAGNAFFAWHHAVGLITLSVVTAFWLWTLLRRSETASGALFPWLSAGRRQAVWHDLRVHFDALRRFRREHADESPLASPTHGLGLLAVSAMPVTGAVMALGRISGRVPVGESQALANLVWAHVIAHASVALLHQAQRHPVLQRMFRLAPG